MSSLEIAACKPVPVDSKGFNSQAQLPYGVNITHIRKAMEAFTEFIGFINGQLHSKQIERLESFLMPCQFQQHSR